MLPWWPQRLLAGRAGAGAAQRTGLPLPSIRSANCATDGRHTLLLTTSTRRLTHQPGPLQSVPLPLLLLGRPPLSSPPLASASPPRQLPCTVVLHSNTSSDLSRHACVSHADLSPTLLLQRHRVCAIPHRTALASLSCAISADAPRAPPSRTLPLAARPPHRLTCICAGRSHEGL
jgi:hypothetical protein